MKKKLKKRVILTSLIILIYGGLLTGMLFVAHQQKKEYELNCRPENLVKLIKTELIEEREKIKHGEKIKRGVLIFENIDSP
jgi:hypothetical protein